MHMFDPLLFWASVSRPSSQHAPLPPDNNEAPLLSLMLSQVGERAILVATVATRERERRRERAPLQIQDAATMLSDI